MELSKKFKLLIIYLLIALPILLNAQATKKAGTLKELQTLAEKAKPGDVIILSEKIYKDESIVISAKGEKGNPVIIKAKTKGNTFIQSPLKIKGKYVELSEFHFNEQGFLEIEGKNCKISRCTWDESKAKKWLRVLPGSSEIEIDNNIFRNKSSNLNFPRDCQLMQIVVLNKNEQHHIHHNIFENIPKGSGNGFETLQIITKGNPFDPPPGDCNSLIEDNLFYKCNGESEIISVKSNGNILRRNTFKASNGALVLRHGDDNIVTQNYFLGEGEPGSGGVRIQGSGQIVANNYFQDLEGYGLGMMDGTPDDLYVQVENAQICYNSFINCRKTFVIGINHSKHPNGASPKNCLIEGNIFFSDKESVDKTFIELVQNDKPENWKWKNNIAFGKEAPELKGIQILNPELKKDKLYLPTNKTPKAEFSPDLNPEIKNDLFGNNWLRNRTVGAIQFPVNQNSNAPLER